MMKIRQKLWAILLFVTVLSLGAASGYAQKTEPDVEFVPTPTEVVLEMLKMANVTKDDVVYDLGCGDGRIVITAAKMFGARGVGIDIDPFRIRESNENAAKAGVADRVKFIRGDLFQTDLSEASVVALYLLPELNLRLRPKLFRELKPGTRIVSHDFKMGDWNPDHTGVVQNVSYQYFEIMGHERTAHFYYWVIPAHAGGPWRLSVETPTGQRFFTLRLEQTFQDIKGSIIDRGQEAAILDAKLIGDQISFTMKDEREKRPVMMHFNGRISGDTMKGSTVVQEGSSTRKHDWTARRANSF